MKRGSCWQQIHQQGPTLWRRCQSIVYPDDHPHQSQCHRLYSDIWHNTLIHWTIFVALWVCPTDRHTNRKTERDKDTVLFCDGTSQYGVPENLTTGEQFFCSHNKVHCSEIPIVLSNLLFHYFFHWIMAHFNFVIGQNAKWGHAIFYIDCHRMTVPENILLQKKHCKDTIHM